MIKLKRAYEPPTRDDGYRALVERLWPRGVRKESLQLATWEKDLAPSAALRTWFGHDPERWVEFKKRYFLELKNPPAADLLVALAARASKETVTLVFAARDLAHNNAVALKEQLERRLRRAKPSAH